MKIEPAKNHSVDRKESKNVFKTDSSVFHSSGPLKNPDSAPPSTGAFAKILEETRKPNDRENSPAAKPDSAETDSATTKSERDEKISRAADEQKELEERGSRQGDGEASQNGDDGHAPGALLAPALQTAPTAPETAAPAARSILHIADLERIVSGMRTETFQNQKQITIALKNSVLQGLQIRLTLTESGKVKAEFLSLNEQIKRQLNQRKNELSEILKNRSTLFSAVEIASPGQAA